MKLHTLIHFLVLKRVDGDEHTEITNIEIDSRRVTPGSLFVCLSGYRTDGHEFVAEAVNNGAVAIMSEKKLPALPSGVVSVIVPDTKRVLPLLAHAFFGHPSQKLRLIGITGTNGKTTTAHMIEHIMDKTGHKTGLIGTLHMKIGNYREKTQNTTPDALKLQRYLKRIADDGGEYAVLEVSSHGLEMGRVTGCRFQTVVLTNLSHDHLDFHHNMESYRNSKELLFTRLGNGLDPAQIAVLNADDEASQYYANRTAVQIITYGIHGHSDIKAVDIRLQGTETRFRAVTPWGKADLQLKVPGLYNVYNALAALTACALEGLPLQAVKDALETFEGVDGRFQEVPAGKEFKITVDYAHNPGGLTAALQTARQLTAGKMICVMGCRGERDRLKRPLMANIATAFADFVFFTSDNPSSEHPADIFEEMRPGLASAQPSSWEFVIDRREAIHKAIQMAGREDRVVITGRGHETGFVMADQVDLFSDADIAKACAEQHNKENVHMISDI